MGQREYHQSKAVELSKSHDFVLIEFPTGMGKGKTVLGCIKASSSPYPWYIIVPEVLQIQNFKAEIAKWGYEYLYGSKIEGIICYSSFGKLKGRECNIVLNECQHLSLLKEDIAQTVKYHKIIADSATIPNVVRERLYSLGAFIEYKVTMSQAIEEGILPKPSVWLHYIPLDDTIKEYMIGPKGKGWRVTHKKYIENFQRQIEYWLKKKNAAIVKGNDPMWFERKIIQLGSQRKMAMSEAKMPYLRAFLHNNLHDRRAIVFLNKISQVEEFPLSQGIHSNNSKKVNIETLQRFNEYEINQLYTNKMGREGLNLKGIEIVALLQLSSGKDDGLDLIQVIGRGLRSEMPEIHLFILQGTKDEDYLEKALLHINPEYVKVWPTKEEENPRNSKSELYIQD